MQSILKHKNFNVEDWIMGKALGNMVEINCGKFTVTWEDPYQIYEITLGVITRLKVKER